MFSATVVVLEPSLLANMNIVQKTLRCLMGLVILVGVFHCRWKGGEDPALLALLYTGVGLNGLSSSVVVERVSIRTNVDLPSLRIRAMLRPSTGSPGPHILFADNSMRDLELYPISEHIVLAGMAQTPDYFVLHYTGQAVSCTLVLIHKVRRSAQCAWAMKQYEKTYGVSTPPGESRFRMGALIQDGDGIIVSAPDGAYRIHPVDSPVGLTASDSTSPCENPRNLQDREACETRDAHVNRSGDAFFRVAFADKRHDLWYRDGVTGESRNVGVLSDWTWGENVVFYSPRPNRRGDRLIAFNDFNFWSLRRRRGSLRTPRMELFRSRATHPVKSPLPVVFCGRRRKAFLINQASFATVPNGDSIYVPMAEFGARRGRTFDVVLPLKGTRRISRMVCGRNRLFIHAEKLGTDIQHVFYLRAGSGRAREIPLPAGYRITALEADSDGSILIAAVRASDGKYIIAHVALDGSMHTVSDSVSKIAGIALMQ